jgi:single-strand DNA-binding protein
MRFNQLTIGGHLGQDAEVKTTNSGEAVTSFSVGVSGYKRDSETTWFRCSWWGDRGAKLAQYLTKGKAVIVSGEVSLRMYEKRDGSSGASLEVRVNEVQLAGGKDESDGGERKAPRTEPQRDEAPAPQTNDSDDVPF